MPVLHILTKSKHSEVSQVLGVVLAPYQGQIQYRLRNPDENLSDIVQGDVVLAMGSQIHKMLANWGAVPKNKGVKSTRSKDINFNGISIITTYDPWAATRDHMTCVDIRIDCALALRRLITGTIVPRIGNYRYVENFDDCLRFIENNWAQKGTAAPVSMDLECVGLDEINPNAWIVSISLTYQAGQADVLYFSGLGDQPSPQHNDQRGYLWKQLHWLFSTKKVKTIGANLKFDMRWVLKKWGIWVENFAFDTTLVGSLLDENRSNSLNNHAKIMTELGGYDDQFNDTADKSRMDLEYLKDPENFKTYAGGDTDAAFRIRLALLKELLPQNGLTRFYAELLHPASKVFTQIEAEGVNVDVQRYRDLEAQLKARIQELHDFAIACINGRVKAKHSKIVNGKETGLKLTRDVIIRDHLFSPLGLNLKPEVFTDKTKDLPPDQRIAKCDKLHLKKFQDHPQAGKFIQAYQEYVATKKTLDTYVTGFLKHLRADGRFHGSYLLFKGAYEGAGSSSDDAGTNTGRLSCKDPALQCQIFWADVLTDQGYLPLLDLVDRFERGEKFKVLTHTGQWRDVIDTYHNGKQPVFKVTTKSGRTVTCTGNHPILVAGEGFVKTEDLKVGDTIYGCYYKEKHSEEKRKIDTWARHVERSHTDVSKLEFYETQMRQGIAPELQRLWRTRDHLLPRVGGLREFLAGYGGAPEGYDLGSAGREQGLLQGQLQMVNGYRTGEQQNNKRASNLERGNEDAKAMGTAFGDLPRDPARTAGKMAVRGSINKGEQKPAQNANVQRKNTEPSGLGTGAGFIGVHANIEDQTGLVYGKDFEHAERAGFEIDEIVSIEPAGEELTFDITVDQCHSYVTQGLVVHNTVPKHTVWAKPLRKCFTPPEGHLMFELDYKAGELRVIAEVAGEPTMIRNFQEGKDPHVLGGAGISKLTYEEVMAFKESKPDLYKMIRSRGKPANFGLSYGMQAEGYHAYARDNYGVNMTLDEAYEQRANFFQTFTGLIPWHESYQEFARKNLYVPTPLGRIRHLPFANSSDWGLRAQSERQAINAPIQATLSDLTQLSSVEFEKEYGMYGTKHNPIRLCMMVHDALIGYVPIDLAQIWLPRLQEVMENLPLGEKFGWYPRVKFEVDAEVHHDSLADLMDFDEYFAKVA